MTSETGEQYVRFFLVDRRTEQRVGDPIHIRYSDLDEYNLMVPQYMEYLEADMLEAREREQS